VQGTVHGQRPGANPARGATRPRARAPAHRRHWAPGRQQPPRGGPRAHRGRRPPPPATRARVEPFQNAI